MAARDLYHKAVVDALEVDGWAIKKDPFVITYLTRTVLVDLAAEGLSLVANKGKRKIAIEIKSFLNNSPIKDLQEAIGQYLMYQAILQETDPSCQLWLAVPAAVYDKFFQEDFTQFVLEKIPMNLVIFDSVEAQVIQWIPSTDTARQSAK
jgi:hypothetical protein